jgi:hypothetical protein
MMGFSGKMTALAGKMIAVTGKMMISRSVKKNSALRRRFFHP